MLRGEEGHTMNAGSIIFAHVSGALLVLGCALTLTGATLYGFVKDPKGPLIFGQSPREWLRLVGEHAALWRWATLPFIAGPIVTVVGFVGLTSLLAKSGDPGFGQMGLLAVALGATLWITNLAARLTVDPWAAQALAQRGEVPEIYTAISAWTSPLYVIYTILTFAGLSVYGGAILASSLLPGWVGWISVAYGIAGLALFALMRDAPPLLHYIIPIMLGVLLLLA
jgi:hypothetical protein